MVCDPGEADAGEMATTAPCAPPAPEMPSVAVVGDPHEAQMAVSTASSVPRDLQKLINVLLRIPAHRRFITHELPGRMPVLLLLSLLQTNEQNLAASGDVSESNIQEQERFSPAVFALAPSKTRTRTTPYFSSVNHWGSPSLIFPQSDLTK
jgi:hypothetical protein